MRVDLSHTDAFSMMGVFNRMERPFHFVEVGTVGLAHKVGRQLKMQTDEGPNPELIIKLKPDGTWTASADIYMDD